MLSGRSGDAVSIGLRDHARADIFGYNFRLDPRKLSTSFSEQRLAGGMVHTRLPVMRKKAGIFIQNAVGELFGQRWTICEKRFCFRQASIPAGQDECWEICIVIKVVMREYNCIDLHRLDAIANQFPCGCRPAVEQQLSPPISTTYADPKLSGVGVGVPHPMIVTFGVVDSFAPTAAFHNFLLEQ